MSEKPNGGPAFAAGFQAPGVMQHGMSLRDYFAGQALAAVYEVHSADGIWSIANITERAYQVADAMLKAREQ